MPTTSEEKSMKDYFVLQVVEAISQFTNYSVVYSNALVDMRAIGINKIGQEEKTKITELVNNLRYFEKHAYLRLSVLSELTKFDMSNIEQYRAEMENVIPEGKQIDKLAKEYMKIQLLKITGVNFETVGSTISRIGNPSSVSL